MEMTEVPADLVLPGAGSWEAMSGAEREACHVAGRSPLEREPLATIDESDDAAPSPPCLDCGDTEPRRPGARRCSFCAAAKYL